jgi:hypothetical protein
MYTDNTILTKGKYKFTKLCRVPPKYLIDLFNHGDKTDPELYEYVKENSIQILLRLNGQIKTPKFITCQKITFPNEKDAKKEIRRIAETQSKLKPQRAYQCEKCGGYHLTSKTVEEFTETKEQFK